MLALSTAEFKIHDLAVHVLTCGERMWSAQGGELIAHFHTFCVWEVDSPGHESKEVMSYGTKRTKEWKPMILVRMISCACAEEPLPLHDGKFFQASATALVNCNTFQCVPWSMSSVSRAFCHDTWKNSSQNTSRHLNAGMTHSTIFPLSLMHLNLCCRYDASQIGASRIKPIKRRMCTKSHDENQNQFC